MDRVSMTPEEAAVITAAAKADPSTTPSPVSAPKPEAAPQEALRPDWCPDQFWKDGKVDQEGLAKSYSEIRAKQDGKTPKADPAADAAAKAVADEAAAKAAAQQTPIVIPGVPAEDVATYTAELKAGDLSQASYEKLAKAGYSKDMVDQYVEGARARAAKAAQAAQPATEKQGASEEEVQARIKEAQAADHAITALKGEVGGDEGLKNMLAWGTANLTPQELAEYNGAVSSGDVAKVKLAVTGLHALYTREMGIDPQLNGGRPAGSNASDVYQSAEQMRVDMDTEKYAKDPAERARVAAKLKRSKIA